MDDLILGGGVLLIVLALGVWLVDARRRHPNGIDWAAELGIKAPEAMPREPSDRFWARLQYAAIAFAVFAGGAGELYTGRASGRAGRSWSRGLYHASGIPVYVAGVILCLAGIALALAAAFPDAKILNRSLGGSAPESSGDEDLAPKKPRRE